MHFPDEHTLELAKERAWVDIERLWLEIEMELEARGNAQRRCPDDGMLSDKIGFFHGDGIYCCRWCRGVWIEP